MKTFKEYLSEAWEDVHIGRGQGRDVYKIWKGGKRLVKKIAKNLDGLLQNLTEVEISKRNPDVSIINHVLDYDNESPKPEWIEVPIASKFNVNLFELQVGYSFKEFSMFLPYYYKLNKNQNRPVSKETENKIIESELFKELTNVINKEKLKPGEFSSVENWGMVKGRPVIIDYGKIDQIFKEFVEHNQIIEEASPAAPFLKFYAAQERGLEPDESVVFECLSILEDYYVDYIKWYDDAPHRLKDNTQRRIYNDFTKQLFNIRNAMKSNDINKMTVAVDQGINQWHHDYPVVTHFAMEVLSDVEDMDEADRMEEEWYQVSDILRRLGRLPEKSPYAM